MTKLSIDTVRYVSIDRSHKSKNNNGYIIDLISFSYYTQWRWSHKKFDRSRRIACAWDCFHLSSNCVHILSVRVCVCVCDIPVLSLGHNHGGSSWPIWPNNLSFRSTHSNLEHTWLVGRERRIIFLLLPSWLTSV